MSRTETVVLRNQGYDAQLVEFVELEHTPKNVLIRAVRRPNNNGTRTTRAFIRLFFYGSRRGRR